MPTWAYSCTECGVEQELVCPHAGRPDGLGCECGGIAHYRIGSPAVMRASYVDGTKRKGWAEMREVNKLQKEAGNSRVERKKEIAREIRKLGGKPAEGGT